jgi:FkbM family methyltransferase
VTADSNEFAKLHQTILALQLNLIQATSLEETLSAISNSIKERLDIYDACLVSQLLDLPRTRTLLTSLGEFTIYMFSEQAAQWYQDSPIEIYDFELELQLGLLANAKVIYDVGMHCGVWSMFYSLVAGQHGRVYGFEPSMLNIEQSLASFYLNKIDNIRVFPLAIGNQVAANSDSILVDFQTRALPQMPAKYMLFDPPDFVKVDIEGYEYEVITGMPYFFDLCDNIHLEIHIPHLAKRALDYQSITNLIPAGRFDAFVTSTDQPSCYLQDFSGLDGYCSLFLKSK